MDKIPINDKYYDLREFDHPGGKGILELCKDEPDCSALFESYHTFADMNKIKLLMKKYEVGPTDESSMFSFKEKGFYKTIQTRVINHFKGISTKWSYYYLWTVTSSVLLFSLSQYTLFTSDIIVVKSIASLFSGYSMIFIGYNVLHDGSHYAISTYPICNNILSMVIQSFLFWNHSLWSYHHVIKHHQYTGMIGYDPDLYNQVPFFRKSNRLRTYKYQLSSTNMVIKFCIFNLLFPGTAIGQSISYLSWIHKKRLWKMTLPDMIGTKLDYLQYLLSFIYISLYLYNVGIVYLYLYIVGLNTLYTIGSAPDHDMYDTHKQIDTQNLELDWGEIQVRHSGNFMSSYCLFTRYMGGINYQIEHHLFPTLSNHKLKEISPLVKQCCKEFNIPYVCVEDPIDVFNQVINTYKEVHYKHE